MFLLNIWKVYTKKNKTKQNNQPNKNTTTKKRWLQVSWKQCGEENLRRSTESWKPKASKSFPSNTLHAKVHTEANTISKM